MTHFINNRLTYILYGSVGLHRKVLAGLLSGVCTKQVIWPFAGGGVLAAAAVLRDTRVTLKGRACAAGCLKLYMARTPQELVAAGISTSSASAGTVPGSAYGAGPLGTALGAAGPVPSPRAAQDAAASLPQGSVQPALVPAASPGTVVAPGGSIAGLSISSPAQKKAKPSVGWAKQTTSAEPVSFALGWFADSGENDGEERLWLEEQMLVADGVKEKVGILLNIKARMTCSRVSTISFGVSNSDNEMSSAETIGLDVVLVYLIMCKNKVVLF